MPCLFIPLLPCVLLTFAGPLEGSTDYVLSRDLKSIAASPDRVVVVGASPASAFASTDGNDWVRSPQTFDSRGCYVVSYANGLFWAGDLSGQIWQSADGLIWQGPYATGGTSVQSVGHGPRTSLIGSGDSSYAAQVLSTTNGQTFIKLFGQGQSGFISGLAYGAGRWVVTGSRSGSPSDFPLWLNGAEGSSLTEFLAPVPGVPQGLAYGNSVFVATAGTGVAVSSDGVSWRSVSGLAPSTLGGVTFNDGSFILTGPDELVLQSSDGTNWRPASPLRAGAYFGYASAIAFKGRIIAVSDRVLTVIDDTPPTSLRVTQQPQSQLLPSGSRATLLVVAEGRGSLKYQWRNSSGTISGATNSSYSTSTGSTYTVAISDLLGSVTAAPAIIAFGNPPTITVNGSATVAAGTAKQTILNYPFGSTPLIYQWFKDDAVLIGKTDAGLTYNGVSSWYSGTYKLAATFPYGTYTSAPKPVTVTGASSADSTKLVNLSVRSLATASSPLIVGFAISGTARQVLLRGVGPTLAQFGVSSPMQDPTLSLYTQAGTLVVANNTWLDSAGAADVFSQVGAFPLPSGSLDAAIYSNLNAGVFSAIAAPNDGSAGGAVLVEAYDGAVATSGGFTNLSTRSQAGQGASSLLAGFVVSGYGQRKLLIRGVGPGLRQFGLPDAVSQPTLTLYSSSGATLLVNTGWQGALNSGAISSAASLVGAFPLASAAGDAAMLVYLEPGSYSVGLTASTARPGDGLIEIYDVSSR